MWISSAKDMELIRPMISMNFDRAAETGIGNRASEARRGYYSHVAPVSNPDPVWKPAVMPAPPSFPRMSFAVAILAVLAQLWYHAWICSAAALAFVRHREEVLEFENTRFKPPRADTADLRNLRKSRGQ